MQNFDTIGFKEGKQSHHFILCTWDHLDYLHLEPQAWKDKHQIFTFEISLEKGNELIFNEECNYTVLLV